MATPILLFGIGATKSGTSWLYSYLRAHPECYLRSIKELHFFDSLEKSGKNWHLKELKRKCGELEKALSSGNAVNSEWNAAQLADARIYAKILKKHDEAGYLSYLSDGCTGESVVSDITPCYSMLSEDSLSHMASMTDDVRFVFLMRDPVDRLWSHIRMIAKRRSKTGDDIEKRAGWIFNRTLDGGEDHILERGDYRGTLTRLQASVNPDQVFICTFEELFSDDALGRLCRFLGIAPLPGNYAKRQHVGVAVPMSGAQKKRAAAFLEPQYDFVAARMGPLPAAWEANRAGV
ncbi:MAG: sulfotransferase [Albidovulum sp.]